MGIFANFWDLKSEINQDHGQVVFPATERCYGKIPDSSRYQ